MVDKIVWVAYAEIERQFLIKIPLSTDMTVAQAIEQSEIKQYITNIDSLSIGIFGERVTLETKLKAGDRVEIYRPLLIHPQDIRRKRAQKNLIKRKSNIKH